MESQPPVIDIEGLVERDEDALARVAHDLEEPCATTGLFHIAHHGIPKAELQAFDDAMRRFFTLPERTLRSVERSRDNAWGYFDRELTKNRPDWKRVFDYGPERSTEESAAAHSDGTNRWPEGHADLKRIMLGHHAACERLGLALLRAIAVSLKCPEDIFDEHFRNHSSFVRLNEYRPCPEPAAPDADDFPASGRLGVHHHTDAGALTLLYQDRVAGLQARIGGRFVVIDPVPDTLTVNLGDMLQVWSNDLYRSPLPRVLVQRDRYRFSAPFFLNPRYDTICEPLATGRGGDEPAHFKPISWSNFRDQRSAGDYADYGREIQIEDFRIP